MQPRMQPRMQRARSAHAAVHAARMLPCAKPPSAARLSLSRRFKNAAPWAKPFGARVAAAASLLARCMIPLVILTGPILGAVSAGVVYGAPQTAKMASVAASIRAASIWGMVAALCVICCLGIFAAACVLVGAARARAMPPGSAAGAPERLWRDVHAMVLLPLAATLVLVVPMAQRVGILYSRVFLLSEPHLYGMSAAPELLNAAMLAAPLALARLSMCYNWGAFMQAHGGGDLVGDGGGGGGGELEKDVEGGGGGAAGAAGKAVTGGSAAAAAALVGLC
ncbi:MAG: hypothetical protein J3K34DRAFT_112864 [Monoraphidium minutum]|nr:MAG: hypothetical protein J3K34DRAFT_112864 [Monoraphidium minutum]